MPTKELNQPTGPLDRPCDGSGVKRAKFDLEPEDLIAFIDFHHVKSPFVRRQRLLLTLLGVGILSSLPIMIILGSSKPATDMLGTIWPLMLGPIAFIVCFPLSYRWGMRRKRNRLLDEGDKRGFYGPRTLSLEDYGVRESTIRGECIRAWPNVRRILELDTHALIYTSETEAFVLPRRAFDEAKEFESFIESAAKRARLSVEKC